MADALFPLPECLLSGSLFSAPSSHLSLSCILGVHPIFSEDRQGTALSISVLALVFAASRFVLRLGARKEGGLGEGGDREARRGDEGVSQRLRAATVSPRWALELPSTLLSCLPVCLVQRSTVPFPPLAEKPGRVEGGKERRAAGSPIQVASPAVTCLCSQKLLALPATETGQPQSQMTLEQRLGAQGWPLLCDRGPPLALSGPQLPPRLQTRGGLGWRI